MADRLKYLDPVALSAVKNMYIRARLIVEGFITGLHRSPYHGFSVEFSEHRQYIPGDESKHIDWKLFGKTDRYYIKQFEEETNLKAYIVLDSSASMNYSSGGVTKLEVASYIAASLTYLMLRQRDAVGLCIIDDKIRSYIPPSSRSTYLKLLLEQLENLSPGKETDLASNFHELAERIHRRGLIIILSDLMDDPEDVLNGLRHFRYNDHEVIVFHILDPMELDFNFPREALFSDMESGERISADPWHLKEDYALKMKEFIHAYKYGCLKQNIDYYRLDSSANLATALMDFLISRKKVVG